jgi:hypothetical protein
VLVGSVQPKGEWLVSYRYTRRKFEGLRDGTDSVSVSSILGDPYTSVPLERVADVHLFGVSFAPHDRLTLELTIPYVRLDLARINLDGSPRASADGVGDLRMTALVPFIRHKGQRSHVSMGLSAPTGSIRAPDEDGVRLPYDMQVGTGTWFFYPGITYRGHLDRFSWGMQAIGVFPVRKNDLGYSRGAGIDATGWLSWRFADWLSSSLRLGWEKFGNIAGEDLGLDKNISPLNDNKRVAGTRLNLVPGINIKLPILKGPILAMEGTWPAYQSLDGPQLETEWVFTAGLLWPF